MLLSKKNLFVILNQKMCWKRNGSIQNVSNCWLRNRIHSDHIAVKAQAIIGQSTSFYVIKWANWLEVNNSIIQKNVFHFSALSNKNGNILTKLEVHVLATIELQFY